MDAEIKSIFDVDDYHQARQMIFSEDIIFIHNGKAGGSSCARYLLGHLRLPVYSCNKNAEAITAQWKLEHITPLQGIGRHCTLSEALEFIQEFNGKTLKDFDKVIVVIRHPYTLEYSYYRHMQKPQVLETERKLPYHRKLASMDFPTFVEKSNYHRRGHPQEKFFLIDGEIPENVELIRFEELATAFPLAVAPYRKDERIKPFPEINQTSYSSKLDEHLTPQVKELIYQKHKYMFDSGLYDKEYEG